MNPCNRQQCSNPRNEKKQFNFHEKKENLICSLKQVEYFLCHFKKIAKGVKLYRLLK